ncbi:MAG: DUF1365 domain-containing protein [Acidobacteria bacterium]|nr:DUF1365 domain-containing protein [Acidobacteriota bacterium]
MMPECFVPEAGVYSGTLRHRRFRPRPHEFTYETFMAFLDIDRIPELMAQSPLTSHNRFNWASFDDRDHFGDLRQSLRERLAQDAREHGVALENGPVFLLTNLRYLGYCFNPISFYFCYGRDGRLSTILAEVNSTFGESHNYWLSPHNRQPGNALRYQCPKAMHVSPFMGMNLAYDFALTTPGERFVAHMKTLEDSQPIFDATLDLRHEPWTSQVLMRALARHPWMTAKVITAIHWEALRLFLKGVPVFTRPSRMGSAVEEVTKRT